MICIVTKLAKLGLETLLFYPFLVLSRMYKLSEYNYFKEIMSKIDVL